MRPPVLSTWLLARLLPEDDREAVLAELDELYELRAARVGDLEARRWHRRQMWIFVGHMVRHGKEGGMRRGRSAFQQALHERERTGGGVSMGEMMQEIRRAIRRLGRAPVFTAVAVLTIGVGIGAFTSIYALVDGVLLEDMPYENPDELAWVWRDYVEADFPRGWLGGPDVTGMQDHPEVFSGVVAFRSGEANLTGADGSDAERVPIHLAGYDLFEVLGVDMRLGRSFTADEGLPGAADVVVITHEFWVSRFGSDPGVIGMTVYLGSDPAEIIGVAPESFRFVKHGSLSDPIPADMYLPLTTDLATTSPGSGSYAALVRIRSEAHPDQVTAALEASAQITNDYFAQFSGSPVRLWAATLKSDLVDGVRPALYALSASAAFLLLVLSANLATLLLGRAAIRERELGIRAALGANRRRILTSVASESLVIALAGGAVGIGLALVGTDIIMRLAPDDLPRLGAVGVDGSTLLVSLAVTIGMALTAGATPAFHAMRVGVTSAMKEGDGRAGGSARGTRTRSVLVSVQLALSLMLLVAGGMTARAFASLLTADPGFDSSNTLTFTLPLSSSTMPEIEDALAFQDRLRARLSALPGVTDVGATTALPLTQTTSQSGITFPGSSANTGDLNADSPLTDYFRVTPGYFEAAGHRMLAGRAFNELDMDTTATYSIIIDDVLANRFFPGGDAIGRQAAFGNDTAAVVGVVDQARLYNVHDDDRGQVYLTMRRFPSYRASYAVRTNSDPLALAPAVRAIVREFDAGVPIADMRTLNDIVQSSLGEQRLSLTLIVTFALGSLLLATLGLYGVVSNMVTRRRQEIGVRMALGADQSEVVRLVLRQGLRLSVAGAVVGIVGALAAGSVVEGVMVGVDTQDPLVYAAVALGLVAVAAVASYLPARRATRIHPLEALRPD